jgi:FeS assembly protein IscX
MPLTWHDTHAVADLLFERYDTLNPLTVRLADMRKWVLDLEDFTGPPEQADDALLEEIRRAWHERWVQEYGSAGDPLA